MCGIAGILMLGCAGRDRANFHRERLAAERMLLSPSLRRRGPDHRACRSVVSRDGSLQALLVSTRLAITDRVNPDANMPLFSPDGDLAIVFNGEIYNHREMREGLRADYRFRTRSDTEVVLAAYLRWGDRMFERFEGMYAFCLVDRAQSRAILAVDHAGQKPLLHHLVGEGDLVVFASDTDTLLDSGIVPFELDGAALQELTAERYIRDARTHLRGVDKLVNGTWLDIDLARRDRRPEVRRHFRFDIDESRFSTPDAAASALGEALIDSHTAVVKSSEVPPVFLLSSGVDSSSIVALACRDPLRPTTYTLGFATGTPRRAESEAHAVPSFLRAVADGGRVGPSHVVMLDQDDYGDRIDDWSMSNGDLLFNLDAVFLHHLFAAMSQGGWKVAVTGCGPDEVFDGYGYGVALTAAAAEGRDLALAHHGATRALGTIDAARLFWNHEADLAARIAAKIESVLKLYPSEISPLQKAQIINWHTRSQYECAKSDLASSVFGIEARKPHYTRRLTELAFQFPGEWKRRGGHEKWIFRQALAQAGILPAEIADRPKMAFPFPLELRSSPEWRARVASVLHEDGVFRNSGAIDFDVVIEHFEARVLDDNVSEMIYSLCLGLRRQSEIARNAARSAAPIVTGRETQEP